jgi:squalene-hopene/tetraprenyl-beta-curcumene cyclase
MRVSTARFLSACSAALLGSLMTTAFAANGMDPALEKQATQAVESGVKFLRGTQAEDGSWSHSVGITALAARLSRGPGKHDAADAAFLDHGIKFILSKVQPDGAITESDENRNYNTVVSITMLQATGDKQYAKVIADAQKFLAKAQIDEGEGYKPDQDWYGGIGYSDDNRPDLSNQYMALEALRKTSFDPNDPVWKKALVFVNRSQNRSESNDQKWAGNDGGFTYVPGMNPYGGTGSYGGMTHAGLLCLLFAGVDKAIRACRPRTTGSARTTRSTRIPACRASMGSSTITTPSPRACTPTASRSSPTCRARSTTGATTSRRSS